MNREILWLLTLLSIYFLPGHLAAQAPDDDSWSREPVVHERAFAVAADGSTFIGGWSSGLSESCTFGSQAFLKKEAADGQEQWHQLGHANDFCGDAENPLLDMLTGIDPRFIVASKIYDLAIDPATETLAMTGELLLAWNDPSSESELQVTATQGAFVALLTLDGTLISDAYLGPQPAGFPVSELSCATLCRRGEDLGQQHFGGRAVAFDDQADVILTGWTAVEAPVREQDLFIARYRSDLSQLEWLVEEGELGDDCPLDVVVDTHGTIFVTGYGGFHRDTLLARFSPNGQREILTYAVGSGDDEGRRLEIGEDGLLRMHGRLTGQCTFGQMTLGVEGKKQQDFTVLFDENLEPIRGQTEDPFEMMRKSEEEEEEEEPIEGGHVEHPTGIKYQEEQWGTGGVHETHLSDDYHLRLYSGSEAQTTFEAFFRLEREPVFLKRVRLETRSQACYTVSLHIRGFDSDNFLPAGQRDICPGDEPIQVFQISRELSDQLGIDGKSEPGFSLVMVIKVHIEFRQPKSSCQGCKASTPGEDVSIDQLEAEVDY